MKRYLKLKMTIFRIRITYISFYDYIKRKRHFPNIWTVQKASELANVCNPTQNVFSASASIRKKLHQKSIIILRNTKITKTYFCDTPNIFTKKIRRKSSRRRLSDYTRFRVSHITVLQGGKKYSVLRVGS